MDPRRTTLQAAASDGGSHDQDGGPSTPSDAGAAPWEAPALVRLTEADLGGALTGSMALTVEPLHALIITTNFSSNASIRVHEYSSLVAFDVGARATGTSVSKDGMRSGTVTTNGVVDLVFGFGLANTVSSGTGFTLRSSFRSDVTEDRVVFGPGPQEATATMVSGGTWAMLVAAFVSR